MRLARLNQPVRFSDEHGRLYVTRQNKSNEALACIGDKRAVDKLLQLAGHEDSMVRKAAAEALGRIGDERAVDRLLQLTKDEDFFVRQAAAEGLGRIGDERAVHRLLELTRDEYRNIGQLAVMALWQIAWKHNMPIRASMNER